MDGVSVSSYWPLFNAQRKIIRNTTAMVRLMAIKRIMMVMAYSFFVTL